MASAARGGMNILVEARSSGHEIFEDIAWLAGRYNGGGSTYRRAEVLEDEMRAISDASFRAAHAAGAPWPALVKTCLERLMPLSEGTTLGFLYVTDVLAGDLSNILAMLRSQTRISEWVGSVGLGICAAGVETFEEPGIAVMVGAVPADAFHVFAPISGAPYRFDPETRSWMARHNPVMAVVHVDPRRAALDDAVAAISAANSTYLVGGITSARQLPLQVAGNVVEGGVSGVLLAPEIAVAAG